MQEPATAATGGETSDGVTTDPPASVRDRVRAALSGDPFVAAFRRRTEGPPSDPAVSRERFDALDRLPDEPFETTPVRTELVVYSETHVYRWVVTGGTVERSELPRDPETMAYEECQSS
ncbi:MAG: hypothetical protein ABEJ94_00820 [Halorientalis sp.]